MQAVCGSEDQHQLTNTVKKDSASLLSQGNSSLLFHEVLWDHNMGPLDTQPCLIIIALIFTQEINADIGKNLQCSMLGEIGRNEGARLQHSLL